MKCTVPHNRSASETLCEEKKKKATCQRYHEKDGRRLYDLSQICKINKYKINDQSEKLINREHSN